MVIYQKDGQWFAEQAKRVSKKLIEITVVPITAEQAIILRTRFNALIIGSSQAEPS